MNHTIAQCLKGEKKRRRDEEQKIRRAEEGFTDVHPNTAS
jgi:hypothetical protein